MQTWDHLHCKTVSASPLDTYHPIENPLGENPVRLGKLAVFMFSYIIMLAEILKSRGLFILFINHRQYYSYKDPTSFEDPLGLYNHNQQALCCYHLCQFRSSQALAYLVVMSVISAILENSVDLTHMTKYLKSEGAMG